MYDELMPLRKLKTIKDVRVKGAIGVVQLYDADWNLMFRLRQEFIKAGVFLRPFGDIIYIMPAFTITPEELSALTGTIKDVVEKL
jgi:adenosylmethionine-8-amino-7-oxononanoate aminotransferase